MPLKREADLWDRDSGQRASQAAAEDAVVLGPELPPDYRPVTFPEEREVATVEPTRRTLPALDNSGLEDGSNVFLDQTSFPLNASNRREEEEDNGFLASAGDTIRGYYEDFFLGGNTSGAAEEFVQTREEGGFIDTSDFGGEAAPLEAFERGRQSGQEFAQGFTDNEILQQGIATVAGGGAAIADVATAGVQGQLLGGVADAIDEVAMVADLGTSALREVQVSGDDQTVGSRLWSTLSGVMEEASTGGDLNTVLKVAATTLAAKDFVDRAAAGEPLDWRNLANAFTFNTESAQYGEIQVPSGHSAWQALTAGPQAVRQAYEAIENRDQLLAEKQARADALAVVAEDVTLPEEQRDAAALARAQIGVEIEEDANKTATDIANEHTSIWNDLIFDTVFDPAIFLELGTKALTAIRAADLGIEAVQSTNALRAAAGAADELVETPVPQLERLFNDVIAQGEDLVGSEARQSLGRFTPARIMADLNPLNLVAADRAQQAIDGLTYTLSSVLAGVSSRAEAANLLDILASTPTRLIDEGLELAELPSRAELFDDAQDVFTFAQSTIANKGFVDNFNVLADAARRESTFVSADGTEVTRGWLNGFQSLRGNEPLNLRELQAELVQTLRTSANDIYGVVQEGGAFQHANLTELGLKTIAASKKFLSEINLFARPAYMVNNAISGNVFLLDDGLMSNSTFDELGGLLSRWFGPDSVVTQRLGEAVGTLDEDVIRSSALGEEISQQSIFRNLSGGLPNPIAWWIERGIDISSGSASLGNIPIGESRMYLTAFANATQQALTRQASGLIDATNRQLTELGIGASPIVDNVINEMANGAMSGTEGRRALQEYLAGQTPIFPWAELGIADDAIPIVVRDGINDLLREGLDADTFVQRVQDLILNRADGLADRMIDTPPSYDGGGMFDVDLLQDASSVSDELAYAARNADIPVVPAEDQQRINALFAEIESGMEALLGVATDAVGPGVDVIFDTYQDVLRYMDDARRITDVSSDAAQKGEKAWDAHYELVSSAWEEVRERIVEAYGRGMDNMVNPDYQRRYTSTSDDRLSDLILADETELRKASELGALGDDEQFRAAVDANRALVDRARYVAFQAVQEMGDVASFNVLTSVNRLVEQVNAQSVAWRNRLYREYKEVGSIDYDGFRERIGQMWRESSDLKEWLWGNAAREILLRGGDADIVTDIAFRMDGQDVELLRPLASGGDGWVVRSESGESVVSGNRVPDEAKAQWEALDLDYSAEQQQLQAYADFVGAPDTRGAALAVDPSNIDDAVGLVAYLDTLGETSAAFFMRDYLVRWGDEVSEYLTDSFIERLGERGNEILGAIGENPATIPDDGLSPLPDSLLRGLNDALPEGPPPSAIDEPPAWLDFDEYATPDREVIPPDNEFIRMADHDPANVLFDRAAVNAQRTHGADGPDVGAMATHIRQAMDDLLGYVRNNAESILQPDRVELTGRQRVQFQQVMGDLFNQWDDTLFKSAQEGIRRADWNMINYADRRNIDTVLAVISPWSYWSTRTMGTYAERMLNHPRLLTTNANIDEAIAQENERSNVAIYHEGTIGNPYPFGPERLRDPRFAAFPQDGLFVKAPVDQDQQLGGEDRFGAVTPVMNEIQRTFGLNPFIQYGADVVQKSGDGITSADFNPYNYLWPMQTGGLVLSALGVDHSGGSDSLASNVLEEGVAAGKYTLNEAQWIQQYLLDGTIPPEAVAAGVDVEALGEDARRTASRRKLMGARGLGLLGPIGGYSDTVGNQALREQGDLFRQLGFNDTGGDGTIEGSDAARDLFIAENPALRAVWTGAQLSDYFVREELDLEPAQVAANRDSRELRDQITDELFALDAAAKDNAINTDPDIKQGDVREAGRQAIIERARERLGDEAVDAFLAGDNANANTIDIVNFVWESMADQLFPSRVGDAPLPEWTGNGWAPYEIEEREYDLLIRNLNRMERPPYPGDGASTEEWEAWKAANETRRQRQIAETERYIAGASDHERSLIAGRSAEELVDAAESLYRTDVEIEHYKRQRAEQEAISNLWGGYLGLHEDDWEGKREYIAANPQFEQILKDRADEQKKDYWWVSGGLWEGYLAIDGEDFDARRQYIADHPEFEKLLQQKADAEGNRYWWLDSNLWDGYLSIPDDDWQAKREYIATHPEFEQILKRRADERGKDYWWTESGGDIIERRADGSIVRHDRPSDADWDSWNAAKGTDNKLAFLNSNPSFATYYLAMYERQGYEPWWDVDENGKFIRRSGRDAPSTSGTQSGRSSGGRSSSGSGGRGGSGRSGGSGGGGASYSSRYFRPFTIRPPRIQARQLSRELRRSILR